jgi:hypothetical protein
MLDGIDEFECQISAVAIDELVGGPRGSSVDREAQFSQLRETIESLASAKFDAGTIFRGSILRIFAKDITKAMLRDDFSLSAIGSQGTRPDNTGEALRYRYRVCRIRY